MKSNFAVRAEKFMNDFYSWAVENYGNRFWGSLYMINDVVEAYNDTHRRNVKVYNGAVRAVLVTSDYVIKWDYADDDDVNCYGGCDQEYEAYEQIVKGSNYEYLFAEVVRIYVGNMAFNIMPRIANTAYECKHKELAEYLSCDEYYWLIRNFGDLHRGNWGLKNGYPIITDYAG